MVDGKIIGHVVVIAPCRYLAFDAKADLLGRYPTLGAAREATATSYVG